MEGCGCSFAGDFEGKVSCQGMCRTLLETGVSPPQIVSVGEPGEPFTGKFER